MNTHPNRATLYTVLNAGGTVQAEGCTVSEAAIELLTYDGYRYEVRRADPKWDSFGESRWDLWHSDGSAASTRGANHMTCTQIGVYAASEEAAWPLIAREVINHPGWFKGCDVMTDEDYAAMMTEVARDNEA